MLRILFVLLLSLSATPAVAAPGPVLVLGDSLSAAYGISPREGWVALLEERLASAKPIRKVVNASISGETSAGGLARLPALLKEHAPALVVVELGANDGLRGLPLAQLRANLAKILEAVRGAGARAVLVGIELPVNYGPHYRDGLRELYRGLAGEFNVPLVPFLLDGVALDPALMQDDGLHPRAAARAAGARERVEGPRACVDVGARPAVVAHGVRSCRGRGPQPRGLRPSAAAWAEWHMAAAPARD